jgi:hypothetical protein
MSQRDQLYHEIDTFPDFALTPLLEIVTIFKSTLLRPQNNHEYDEDNRLSDIAAERISKYKNTTELEKNSISQAEILSHFGLNQTDLDNAEDVELI